MENDTQVNVITTLRKKNNFINNITILRDGQEALDFIFSNGDYSDEKNVVDIYPSVILLDFKST